MLDGYKRGLTTDLQQLLRQTARGVAIQLATFTAPYGIGDGARRQGEVATQNDIRRCYAIPSQVYGAFSDSDKANAFWFHMMKRNYARAQLLMQLNCPKYANKSIRAFDGGAAHQAARNSRGRVNKKQEAAFVVQSTRNLEAYIKQKISHVGEAKAGWAACAKAPELGGSTRGLPQWVTRHAGKLAGGEVHQFSTGHGYSIRLVNLVRYADQALSPSMKAVAIRMGIDRIIRGMLAGELRGRGYGGKLSDVLD